MRRARSSLYFQGVYIALESAYCSSCKDETTKGKTMDTTTNTRCCDQKVVAEGRKNGESFGLCSDCADRFESYAEEHAGVGFRWL